MTGACRKERSIVSGMDWMNNDIRRYRLKAYGRVQGVGFRWFVRRLAEAQRLTGFAENEWDGSVTVELQGRTSDIEKVMAAIYRGNTYIDVEHMDAEEISPDAHDTGFYTK